MRCTLTALVHTCRCLPQAQARVCAHLLTLAHSQVMRQRPAPAILPSLVPMSGPAPSGAWGGVWSPGVLSPLARGEAQADRGAGMTHTFSLTG